MKPFVFAFALALTACAPPAPQKPAMTHPVTYFEIPVTDMPRAIAFYGAVFGVAFEQTEIDGYEMALFPYTEGQEGPAGALAKGDVYRPTIDGALIYFHADDIDSVLARALKAGGEVLYPKKHNGLGYVAEFKDSEGNRIALFQPEKAP